MISTHLHRPFYRLQWLLLLFLSQNSLAYKHPTCSRRDRAQFQLEDCSLPTLSNDILLSQASFVFSHNAGTGYLQTGNNPISTLSRPYVKTQVGTAYQQLKNGARALDLRLYLTVNQTIVLHHGNVVLPRVTLERIIEDVLQWTREHSDELVLLLNSHYRTSSSSSASKNSEKDDSVNMSVILSQVYERLGVPFVSCDALAGITIGAAMELAGTRAGGHVLAIDAGQGGCIKENYVESALVSCWGSGTISSQGNQRSGSTVSSNSSLPFTSSCHRSVEPYSRLVAYLTASATGEPTDDASTLSPASSLPFSELQALWQATPYAIVTGLAHGSSLLHDNRLSKINEKLVRWLYDKLNTENGENFAVSLWAMDNVAWHGNALLSVLRTTCGQTNADQCGAQLGPPRLHARGEVTVHTVLLALLGLYMCFIVLWVARQAACGKRNNRLFRIEDSSVDTETSATPLQTMPKSGVILPRITIDPSSEPSMRGERRITSWG